MPDAEILSREEFERLRDGLGDGPRGGDEWEITFDNRVAPTIEALAAVVGETVDVKEEAQIRQVLYEKGWL